MIVSSAQSLVENYSKSIAFSMRVFKDLLVRTVAFRARVDRDVCGNERLNVVRLTRICS